MICAVIASTSASSAWLRNAVLGWPGLPVRAAPLQPLLRPSPGQESATHRPARPLHARTSAASNRHCAPRSPAPAAASYKSYRGNRNGSAAPDTSRAASRCIAVTGFPRAHRGTFARRYFLNIASAQLSEPSCARYGDDHAPPTPDRDRPDEDEEDPFPRPTAATAEARADQGHCHSSRVDARFHRSRRVAKRGSPKRLTGAPSAAGLPPARSSTTGSLLKKKWTKRDQADPPRRRLIALLRSFLLRGCRWRTTRCTAPLGC